MKKFLKLNIYAVTLLMIMFSATSCLKDDEHLWDFSDNNSLIEIPETPSAATGCIPRAVDIAESVDLVIPINLAAVNPANVDLKVTLALDKEWLDLKNVEFKKNGSSTFELLPDNTYTVSSWDVTIPAGKNLVNFVVKMKSNLVDVTKKYVLPIRISKVPDGYIIPSNFSRVLINPLVKNKYDGKYLMKGYILREGDAVLSGYFKDREYSLITVGANSVVYDKVHKWADGSNVGGIGPWTLTVAADNKVTVTDDANAAVKNNPNQPSYYDPVKKMFVISVYWGNGPTHRAAVDTLVYEGPR